MPSLVCLLMSSCPPIKVLEMCLLKMRSNHKLAARYYGPYKVTKRVGKVAYQINLPAGTKIHNVFHVSQLKKLGTKQVLQIELPGINEAKELESKPVAILDRKLVKKGIYPVVMVKRVQWEQGDDEDATWEEWDQLKKRFPNFNP